MKRVVWKWFWAWNIEKEEAWLNEMSAKGWQLVKVSFCRYSFEKDESRQYNYKIDMLDNWPGRAKNAEYIQFLEESGVECVTSWVFWAYFRKRAADGAFEIYSDVDSKAKPLKNSTGILGLSGGVCLTVGLANIALWCIHKDDGSFTAFNLYIGIITALVGILCLYGASIFKRRIAQLKKDKQLQEHGLGISTKSKTPRNILVFLGAIALAGGLVGFAVGVIFDIVSK